jgi:hypothetical protein
MSPPGAAGPEGEQGPPGADGDDAYVYIAYASADDGTDFTLVFNAALNYIAIKHTTVAIPSPVVGDFAGLWKNYKGATGATGAPGADGADGADGIDGNTVLNGDGAPGAGLGFNGDFYIDTTNDDIYGPKAGGAWGAGTSLIGPEGPPGGSGHVIQDETTPMTARANLNFAGAGVTVTDDAGNDATIVTIPGGAGGGDGWLVSQIFS